LATTKQAAREETDALIADEYLADLVYNALLERGEPSKVSEITLEINNPRISFPVVRRVLSDSPRFLSVDRMWTLKARYLDRSRPTERNLVEVMQAAGRALDNTTLATELSEVYGRPAEVYFPLLSKVLKNEKAYFRTTHNEYGPIAWLPLVDGEEEEDVLFDNSLKRADLAPYADAPKLWNEKGYAAATRAVVEAVGRPVPHRVLGVLAWLTLREDYDPRAHLVSCLADSSLVWLSTGRWVTRAQADKLERLLEERGALLASEDGAAADDFAPEEPAAAIADPEPTPAVAPAAPVAAAAEPAVITAPDPAPVPAPAEDAYKSIDVTDSDLSALEQIISERGTVVDASELLALRYEVVAGDPSYRADVTTLTERLKSDDRFQHVGAGRFREPNSLPLFVFSVPEFLAFPDLQFVSMDGEIMDEEIEDEGFAANLRQEMLNPLAQDVADDEGRYTGPGHEPGASVRCVVKSHHKEIGTFPLCQIPDGFFPADAPVVEIVVRDADGNPHDVIVNNDLRLVFNLFGLYEALPHDSGSVFLLHPAARPYEFRFEARPDEQDPQAYVAPQRFSELLALREQAEESGDVATFDITCEVLAHQAKGLDFVQLLTEVNIVRRVTRRKLASILSNYLCFFQKPGQPVWRFDAKKREMGTDRAKRKYLKR